MSALPPLPPALTKPSVPRRDLVQYLREAEDEVREQLVTATDATMLRMLQGRAQILRDLIAKLGV